jgi:hypothetical protein
LLLKISEEILTDNENFTDRLHTVKPIKQVNRLYRSDLFTSSGKFMHENLKKFENCQQRMLGRP